MKLITEELMRQQAAEFDSLDETGFSNTDYFSITYICIEGGSDLSNEFGILTANEEFLCFYMYKFMSSRKIGYSFVFPYSAIYKLKIRKFFIWNSLKIFYRDDNGKKRKLKLVIASKVLGQGMLGQKENVAKLLEFLKQRDWDN